MVPHVFVPRAWSEIPFPEVVVEETYVVLEYRAKVLSHASREDVDSAAKMLFVALEHLATKRAADVFVTHSL